MDYRVVWIARLIIVAFSLQSVSCAYMERGTTDKIRVDNFDSHAKLYVDGQFIGTGSGTSIVKRNRTYTIAAKKDGCATAIQDTESKFDRTSLIGWVDNMPLVSVFASHTSAVESQGRTSPLIYTRHPDLPAGCRYRLNSSRRYGRDRRCLEDLSADVYGYTNLPSIADDRCSKPPAERFVMRPRRQQTC
jgi:hypothetical protein